MYRPGSTVTTCPASQREIDAGQTRPATLAAAQRADRVTDTEADEMPDPMREEEADRAAVDQAVGIAAQQPELDQPLGEHDPGRAVHVEPFDPHPAQVERLELRGADDRVPFGVLGVKAVRPPGRCG